MWSRGRSLQVTLLLVTQVNNLLTSLQTLSLNPNPNNVLDPHSPLVAQVIHPLNFLQTLSINPNPTLTLMMCLMHHSLLVLQVNHLLAVLQTLQPQPYLPPSACPAGQPPAGFAAHPKPLLNTLPFACPAGQPPAGVAAHQRC